MAKHTQAELDAQIIKDNPNMAPHDLLTQKQLSEKGFNDMVTAMQQQAHVNLNAKPPVPQMQLLEPNIANLVPTGPSGGHVRVVPINGVGMGTLMDAEHAARFIKSYPNEYRIVK